MNKPLSIKAARRIGFKTRAKNLLGQIATFAFPQKAAGLTVCPVSEPSGFIDKTLMSYLKRRAMLTGNQAFFERLHRNFWIGEGGHVYSNNCNHRFHELFLKRQREDFLELEQLWKNSNVNQIVEFGSNSGLVLNYITQQLEGVTSSIGIEINQQQVDRNRNSGNFDSRIEFECNDGGQWLFENGKPNTLFVSNGGVLEYFRRERLDEMLQHISQSLIPALFFSSEPVAADHDWSMSKESIPFGEELSFSHNYTDLFESNGFEIVHQRATMYQSWKMVATVARTTNTSR